MERAARGKGPREFYLRTYRNILSGLLRPDHPSYLIFYVNNTCQLRCRMCFYWDAMQVKTGTLSLEEIDRVASHFHDLLQLTLTGGEPFLRKDLAAIAGIFSRRSRLAKCTVVTNGMQPERVRDATREMVLENPEVDFRLTVSVDGVDALHDEIRGVEGSWDNLLTSLDHLFAIRATVHNLWVDATTVVSKYNHHAVEELFHHVKRHFPVDNFSFSYVRGRTKEEDAKDLPHDIYDRLSAMSRKEPGRSDHFFQGPTSVIRNIVKEEVARELATGSFHNRCTAARKFVEIYQDGSVAPCEILETRLDDHTMGNIRDFDFDINKLLRSPKAQEMIRFIRESRCHCTFECPKHMDIMYNRAFYVRIVKGLLGGVRRA